MEKIKFYTKPTISSTPELKMVIDVNGNVGIGESNPTKALEVVGDISFNGDLYQNGTLFTGGSTIDETTNVSLNNLNVHGDLSANDASFNVIETTSLRINGVDIIDGAPETLDTLNELATSLSNKQDTLTAGTNITITGNTISASSGGGSSNFIGLTDTPSSFTANKFLAVNSGGTAVEFVDAPSGGGGASPWVGPTSSGGYYINGSVGIGTTDVTSLLDLGDNTYGGNIIIGHTSPDPNFISAPTIGKYDRPQMYLLNGITFGKTSTEEYIDFTTSSYQNGRYGERGMTLDGMGDLYIRGYLYTSSYWNASDNRIKHNEQLITNALSTISKLIPKHYFKTARKIYDPFHNFVVDASGNPLDISGNPLKFKQDYTIETGIIAQEIRNIPELKFAVYGEEYIEETVTTYKKDNSGNDVLDESGNKIIESIETQQKPNTLAVDYNSIHCTHIAATKELHQLVESQQTTIQTQQQEITNLKQENTTLTQRLQTIEQHLGI